MKGVDAFFPTQAQLRDPHSDASVRYRRLARNSLADRNVHPRMVNKLVPDNIHAINAIVIIAIAKNNFVR